ncbi:hypothetical protein [Ectobacillus panaciterrae]|uniref:hypothetical protein n=1 Tax=Ectobacillus panaciterrae TaxID=363872 RepID=UPI00040274D1|nr:hypothetical protein [Ectobacillus panaciterrae]
MNKSFLITGIISLLLVVLFIWTRPGEEKFDRHMKEQYGITCREGSFTCKEADGELELIGTNMRNGVFFMTIEKKFQTNTGQIKTVKALGMLGAFWDTSVTEK